MCMLSSPLREPQFNQSAKLQWGSQRWWRHGACGWRSHLGPVTSFSLQFLMSRMIKDGTREQHAHFASDMWLSVHKERERNPRLTFCFPRCRDKDVASLRPGNVFGQLFWLTILTAFYLQTCRVLFDKEPNKLPPHAGHGGGGRASIPVKAALWM